MKFGADFLHYGLTSFLIQLFDNISFMTCLKFFFRLYDFTLLKNTFFLPISAFFLDSSCVFNDDCARIKPSYYIFNIMSVFELFTGIWRLEEGAFFVAELPRCIVSPIQKSTIIERAYAMSPAALYVVDEKRLVGFVEQV